MLGRVLEIAKSNYCRWRLTGKYSNKEVLLSSFIHLRYSMESRNEILETKFQTEYISIIIYDYKKIKSRICCLRFSETYYWQDPLEAFSKQFHIFKNCLVVLTLIQIQKLLSLHKSSVTKIWHYNTSNFLEYVHSRYVKCLFTNMQKKNVK